MLTQLYDRLIVGLAGIAGAILVAIVIGVAADVTLRGAGIQPPPLTAGVAEYGLLFVTMLAAPWLVRTRGHIVIDGLVGALPPRLRRMQERFVYLLCTLLCLTLAYFAAENGLASHGRGDIDIRSIDMPRWILFAALSLGFAGMAVEFCRYLLGPRSFYAPSPTTPRESL